MGEKNPNNLSLDPKVFLLTYVKGQVAKDKKAPFLDMIVAVRAVYK